MNGCGIDELTGERQLGATVATEAGNNWGTDDARSASALARGACLGSAIWVCSRIVLELLLLGFCRLAAKVWQWRMRMLALPTPPMCFGRGRASAAAAAATKSGQQVADGWWLMDDGRVSYWNSLHYAVGWAHSAGCLNMSLCDAHCTWLSTKLFCSKANSFLLFVSWFVSRL